MHNNLNEAELITSRSNISGQLVSYRQTFSHGADFSYVQDNESSAIISLQSPVAAQDLANSFSNLGGLNVKSNKANLEKGRNRL